MRVLVTAGSTEIPIDKVRCISNIFRGRTGTETAGYFSTKDHYVVLLTSSPELVSKYSNITEVVTYKTYDELMIQMESLVTTGNFDVIIHSAAVSDYRVEGTYVQDVGDYCIEQQSHHYWMTKLDSSGKIGSDHSELYLKLVPTEKIVDKIRRDWGFTGTLVKFKLQVDISEKDLIDIAVKSMRKSQANIIVANRLETSKQEAWITQDAKNPTNLVSITARVDRQHLPSSLYNIINKSVGK